VLERGNKEEIDEIMRYYQLTESDLRKFKPRFLQPTDLTNFRSFLFGWGDIAKFTLRA